MKLKTALTALWLAVALAAPAPAATFKFAFQARGVPQVAMARAGALRAGATFVRSPRLYCLDRPGRPWVNFPAQRVQGHQTRQSQRGEQ